MDTSNPFEATPETVAEIAELAAWAKNERRVDPQLFIGYVCGNCGLPVHRVITALRQAWPEAVEFVQLSELDELRFVVMNLRSRRSVLGLIERRKLAVASDDNLDEDEIADFNVLADELIHWWDSVNFPNQVPEPLRKRCLECIEWCGVPTRQMIEAEREVANG